MSGRMGCVAGAGWQANCLGSLRIKNETMPLLTLDELQEKAPILKIPAGENIGKRLMQWLNVDRVNELYDSLSTLKGPDFASAALMELGVRYELLCSFNLQTLPEGPFIVIANHPYGSLDGVMLVDIFGHLRPDFKIMVNGFLSRVDSLDENFIKVTPKLTGRCAPTNESLQGVRAAMEHVRQGHPIGICPSGAVSDLSLKDGCIRDREWQEPVIRLIKKLRVPIVPVHFLDRNSDFYYLLGLIDWRIRLLRLPSEVFNKSGRPARIAVGNVIPVNQQDGFTDISAFRNFLRSSVYVNLK